MANILNRYWDENNTPRPESYGKMLNYHINRHQTAEKLYRNLRAGAESGWDFSCRWFKDENSFGSIHTTDIVPVDLNCLLLHLEQTIADAYSVKANKECIKSLYLSLAEKRKEAIQKYCWNDEARFLF